MVGEKLDSLAPSTNYPHCVLYVLPVLIELKFQIHRGQ